MADVCSCPLTAKTELTEEFPDNPFLASADISVYWVI